MQTFAETARCSLAGPPWTISTAAEEAVAVSAAVGGAGASWGQPPGMGSAPGMSRLVGTGCNCVHFRSTVVVAAVAAAAAAAAAAPLAVARDSARHTANWWVRQGSHTGRFESGVWSCLPKRSVIGVVGSGAEPSIAAAAAAAVAGPVEGPVAAETVKASYRVDNRNEDRAPVEVVPIRQFVPVHFVRRRRRLHRRQSFDCRSKTPA